MNKPNDLRLAIGLKKETQRYCFVPSWLVLLVEMHDLDTWHGVMLSAFGRIVYDRAEQGGIFKALGRVYVLFLHDFFPASGDFSL